MIVLLDNERNTTSLQIESKESSIRYMYEYLSRLEDNKQYSNMKNCIDKQLKRAEKLKTQKGKDKIYNQIEHYKQRTKDVFNFDYDAHVDNIIATKSKVKTLEDELKMLKDKLTQLQNQFETAYKSEESYMTYMSTNVPLCDKVWNRRSNR